MKILLAYPRYPESFWSFKHALRFINKKAAHPPLGLLTVAAMLPGAWEKRLIDMNVRPVKDADLKWADYVFISAMTIQRESARELIGRCRSLGVKTVAGGPLFTMEYDEFAEVDHLVLDEAEITLAQFLADLEKGTEKHIYTSNERPDIGTTPVPLWELINLNDYVTMSVQFSRGCPYDCEFCDITSLYGRKPRLKNVEQFIGELDSLYHRGWKGSVFIVDDNFIGNKVIIKKEILPAIIEWMDKHRHPFVFITEVSINLADDQELMDLMRRAGFAHVFIGIETPSEDSLKECNKFNNVNRDMLASVKRVQNYGMEVSAGFIVGFDSDTPSIFERQIKFIQQSGIVTAMVGLLNAPRGTRLFERLKNEKRLLQNFSGNNTDFSLNFVPKMNTQKLIEGYKQIVTTIYSPAQYYERVLQFFGEFKPARGVRFDMFRLCYLKAFFMAMFYLGVLDQGRKYYWRLLLKTLWGYPHMLPQAISFAIYGFHFRKVFNSFNPAKA
ncbi:B12-binding domain-containing radical SAM protein [Desulfotomaculum copahuensis]|uniref:B12-binding domain-containing radical SAM protein n=1 Tax=Desulfotomaculum copahuensis TaxID=1838280 RepID=A0A1B7LGA1_9FIRM|nr:B12-binding domain-containing radical SAM protein [Desulfotomaculum copahuensis]OAT84997.1 B12-binding domain-containing radical SAM protein [Desulfotomaculum copahuensis]